LLLSSGGAGSGLPDAPGLAGIRRKNGPFWEEETLAMAGNPMPPVPERRFLGTQVGADKGAKDKREGKDKPAPKPTGQLPKR
jgi:hypothetical protein